MHTTTSSCRTLLSTLFLVAACGGRPNTGGPSNGSIDGRVVVTGPVAGAVVTAYAFDLGSGAPAEVLAVAEPTPADGTFHLDLGPYEGPVLLVARGIGATYREPASDVPVAWDASTELRGMYVAWTPGGDLTFTFPREATVTDQILSPWTDLVVTYAEARLQSGRSPTYAIAVSDAHRRFRDHLEVDFWSTPPADLTQPTSGWNASVQAGVEIAGFSMLTRRAAEDSSISPAGLTSLHLQARLTEDLRGPGAQLDGEGTSPLFLGTCSTVCPMSGRTLRADLAEAIAAFLGSPQNGSGIGVTDAERLLARIAARESDLFGDGGEPTFDTTPPAIAVQGVGPGDVLIGSAHIEIVARDAWKMGEVTFGFGRGGVALPPFYVVATAAPDAQTRIVALDLDTVAIPDGPVTLHVEAIDDAGNVAAPVDIDFLTDNHPIGHIAGVVIAGGPVVGARVRAWEYDGAAQGALLGEAMTDEAGFYSVPIAETIQDTIQLQADSPATPDAAFYVEASSGATVTLSTEDRIESLIAGWIDGQERGDGQITPLTSAAASFAEGIFETRYGGDPAEWPSAIGDAFAILEAHIAHDVYVDLRTTPPADLTSAATATLNAQARYGLVLTALGQLADLHAEMSGATPASMNTLSLTRLLVRDLGEDGAVEPLWDGRTGAGVLSHGDVALDSYATRVDLAVAAVAFLETNPRNATPFIELDVASLLDHISTDDNPRLYPASEPPIPYDVIPPQPVLFASPTPPDGQVLRGAVALRAEASDNRALADFVWSAPASSIADSLLDTSAGPAGPWALVGSLDTNPFPEGPVTVAVEATDEAAQATEVGRTFVVDRTSPGVTIGGAMSGTTFLPQGAWTSADALTAFGTIYESHPGTASAAWNGASGMISVAADGTFISPRVLVEGLNTLQVTAIDQAGNAGTTSVGWHRDSIAPVVTVGAAVTPGGAVVPSGGWTPASTLTISGMVLEANLYHAEIIWNGAPAPLSVGAAGSWSATRTLIAGTNTLAITATDWAGNHTTASATYRRDSVPPVVAITGATTGTGPLAEGGWTGPGYISITGAVIDTNLTSATFSWNGGAPSPLTIAGGGGFLLAFALAPGANTLSVTAVDAAGNTATDTATWNSDQTAPTVSPVASSLINEASMTASVSGTTAPGSVTYSGGGPAVTLGGAGSPPHYTKWASRYTLVGPNLPEWRFMVADNHTATSGVVLQARISRMAFPSWSALTGWLAVPAAPAGAAGYNRAQVVTDFLSPTIGRLGGDYQIEIRALDEYGNTSGVQAFTWSQSIKAPPVRQRAGVSCSSSTDLQCAQHYGLSTSYAVGGTPFGANTAATVVAGAGLPGGKLHVGSGFIDNPNPVPVRVRLSPATLTTYTRGSVWTHPQTAITSSVTDGCMNSVGDMLLDGTCYAAGSPLESITTGASAGDLYAGFEASFIDGTPLPACTFCAANEREVPAFTSIRIMVLANPYTFLFPAPATEIGTVGSTLLNVTGSLAEEWLDCIAAAHPPGEPVVCTSQVKRRAVRYLTRVDVNPVTTVSLDARPAAEGAAWAPAFGTDVSAFGYGNSNWYNVETGW